jgi:hypothetical protein
MVKLLELIPGLKLEVNEKVLNNLVNEPYIQENFKLNIKRLNRWRYSVYFAKKCKHERRSYFDNDIFCPDCGERLDS